MSRYPASTSAVRVATADPTPELDWEHVYDAHAPRLRRLIQRKLGSAASEDVLQETFLRAFKSRHTIDHTRSMRPWLNTVALRAIADVQRGAVKTVEAVDIDIDIDVAVDLDSNGDAFACDALDDELLARARRMGIKHAFASLNSRHRRLLQLVDVEGMPYEYVARHEDMTTDAVRAALARARTNFRASYIVFTRESGLFGVGGLVASVAMKVRLRWQRYQDFVAHHFAGVTAATLTVAVVAAATIPTARPAPTRASEGAAKMTTAFLIGSMAPETATTDLHVTVERHPSAPATVPQSPAQTDRRAAITAAAEAEVRRERDHARAAITVETTAPGADRETWAVISVECNGGVLADTKCELVKMLPPPPSLD